MNLADYQWLTSPASAPWLAEAAAAGDATVRLAARMRRELSAARVHLVLEQAELRQRAKTKFAAAERMFFTRKGLEQASGEAIASYKASRFPRGAPAADLCCGVGGDLLALASRGPVTGVERDAITAHLAAANLEVVGVPREDVRVVGDDAVAFPVGGCAAWHIDPDRRVEGRRTSDPELHDPPLAQIETLLAASPAAAIKLAPAAALPDDWRDSTEIEWIGWRGECRQQVAWSGPLARHPGRRAATIVPAAGGAAYSIAADERDGWVAIADRVGRYIYEPHAAVLAARLSPVLAVKHHLLDVNQHGYLTADHLVDDPALAAFEVLDVVPADRKQMAAWCHERGIGRVEIKVRGLDIAPERLRKELKLPAAENSATVLLFRHRSGSWAAMARRIEKTELRIDTDERG